MGVPVGSNPKRAETAEKGVRPHFVGEQRFAPSCSKGLQLGCRSPVAINRREGRAEDVLLAIQKTLAEFGYCDRLKRGEGCHMATSEFGIPFGGQSHRFGLRLADPDSDRVCALAVIEISRAVMLKIREAAHSPAARLRLLDMRDLLGAHVVHQRRSTWTVFCFLDNHWSLRPADWTGPDNFPLYWHLRWGKLGSIGHPE
jgi:hypothetical protein